MFLPILLDSNKNIVFQNSNIVSDMLDAHKVRTKLGTTKRLRVSGLSVSSLPQGSWDLVTAYNMRHNPTYSWGNPCKAI